MQTRYMELRADRASMQRAQKLMLEEEAEAAREEREQYKEKTLKLYRQMEAYREMRERKQHNAAEVLFYYILIAISPRSIFDMFPRTAPSFNRLAA
jgi:hypothetical protein